MHKLTDRDDVARKATCAVCGPVTTHKTGKTFKCSVAQKARMKSWAERNPEMAERNRSTVSDHKLIRRNAETLTGDCPQCGSVAIVPYGRGYTCANSPAVKRRGIQEAAPKKRCGMCNAWESDTRVLNGTGHCPVCEADMQLQADAARGQHRTDWYYEDALPAELSEGFHIENEDAYWDSRVTNAVPGWRTLG